MKSLAYKASQFLIPGPTHVFGWIIIPLFLQLSRDIPCEHVYSRHRMVSPALHTHTRHGGGQAPFTSLLSLTDIVRAGGKQLNIQQFSSEPLSLCHVLLVWHPGLHFCCRMSQGWCRHSALFPCIVHIVHYKYLPSAGERWKRRSEMFFSCRGNL